MEIKYANKRKLGEFGELKAKEYLEKDGYLIVESNFRVSRIGELDIIATKDNVLCFVEVKSRQNIKFGDPCESLIYSKIKNIKMLAEIFLKKIPHYSENIEIRFDVIEVYFSYINFDFKVKSINHIISAF